MVSQSVLGISFALLIGFCWLRLYGWYTARGDTDPDRASVGTYRHLVAVGFLTFVGTVIVGDFPARTEAVLESVDPALAGGVAMPLAWIPALGTVFVVVIVSYLGVFPYARQRADTEISATRATWRLARFLLALFAIAVVVTAVTGLLFETPFWVAGPVAGTLFIVLFYVWGQFSTRLVNDVSEPTEKQRRRLEEALESTGIDAPIAGVLPGVESRTAAVYLQGPFWNRRLYVTDYALETCSDAALEARCAREAGSHELRMRELKAITAGVLLASVVVGLSVFGLLGLVGALGCLLVFTWWLRRRTLAADRAAAGRTETAPLLETYETDHDSTAGEGGRLRSLVSLTPPLERRLEAVRSN